MVVINGHELVILLLGDFVAHGFAVYDGGHAVLALSFGGFYPYLVHGHLPSMPALSEPALVRVDVGEVVTVHHHRSLWQYPFFRLYGQAFIDILPLPALLYLPHLGKLAVQVFLERRMQFDGNHLVTIQHVHCDRCGKILLDDAINDFQPFFHRHILCRVVSQSCQFLVFQVILQIGRDGGRLYGQRLALGIYEYAVAR